MQTLSSAIQLFASSVMLLHALLHSSSNTIPSSTKVSPRATTYKPCGNRVRAEAHTRLRHDAGERDVTGRSRMTYKIMAIISQKAAAYIECEG